MKFFIEVLQLTFELEKALLLPISVVDDTKRHEFNGRRIEGADHAAIYWHPRVRIANR
jgi:hypothetical protein